MRRISHSLIYSGVAFFSLATVAVVASGQEQPFRLILAAPSQPLKAGQPLILRATVTNTSDHEFMVPLSLGSPDVGRFYEVHVLDDQGHPAPPWAPPPPAKGKTVIRIGTGRGKVLQPGQSVKDEVNISHVYDLSQPGKYDIWIAEPFYGEPDNVPKGLVKSNSITVTVVK